MKARIIYTSYYQSERVLSLSADARWLFMYYLTCPYIGLTGVFKLARSKIKFESALDETRLSAAEQELIGVGLIDLLDGWIIIPGTQEKTNYNLSKTTGIAYSKELERLPQNIKARLIKLTGYPIDTVYIPPDTPRNRNNNRNPIKGELHTSTFNTPNSGETAEQVADDFEEYQKGLN